MTKRHKHGYTKDDKNHNRHPITTTVKMHAIKGLTAKFNKVDAVSGNTTHGVTN